MTASAGRLRAFDWLRGIAVLVMIQCHAMTLLRPELASNPVWPWLRWLDGLVAPSFIFAAGFSLALVQVRGASGGRLKRVRKTLRRLGEVLLVATLVNWMWFPIFREPKWILRIDILQCIGVSLLIALPLLAGLATRPRMLAGVSFALAMAVFLVSPFGEGVHNAWTPLLNGSMNSVFPLLPWAGYVYLGASAGAIAAMGNQKLLARWVVGLGALGVVLRLCAPVFLKLYPPHQFFVTDPANHGERWALVCAFLLVLRWRETHAVEASRSSAVVRFVEVFGTSSLSGYFLHEMFLYFQFFGFSFDAKWGKSCGWLSYSALTVLLIAITYVATRLVDVAYARYQQLVDPRPARPAVASAPVVSSSLSPGT